MSKAVAVYCASSTTKQPAFRNAARSVGHALAAANRPLVYGGGSSGLMGITSAAALEKGGHVTAVIPYAMLSGERPTGTESGPVELPQVKREEVETIVVKSMHQRKVEMAKRSCGFIGLPGGFGTLEEVLEVSTWTQIGIHLKPVVLLNVLSFFSPLRDLIKRAVQEGFIQPLNDNIIIFVDGPAEASSSAHESFDWGNAALEALDRWRASDVRPLDYDWAQTVENTSQEPLEAT